MLEAGETRFSVTEGLCQAVGMLADAVVKRTSGAKHRMMELKRRFLGRKIMSGGMLLVSALRFSIWSPKSLIENDPDGLQGIAATYPN
jgi:hypothetical protein